MLTEIYTGSLSVVEKSGVGRAIFHQLEMLKQAGVETTTESKSDADIVHINTIFPDSVFAANRAHKQGKKVIWYGHSTMEDFRNSFVGSNALAPLFKRWISFCYNHGDVILTPTAYSKNILDSYGLKRPIYSISNGIDTEFFKESAERRAEFREKYDISDAEKIVISVGHYMERKGLPDFVKLAKAVPNARFMWFGYTEPALVTPEIRAAMADAPDNLQFPGYIDKNELCSAYCGADAFVFMSHEETEGIVVLEALSCGTPTLVRDIPVYADWLKDGENVYKADSIDGFAQKLNAMLSGTLPSLTANAHKTANERSMRAMGEKLVGIYKSSGLLS